MRVRVRDAVKDSVLLEEQLETADVLTQCKREQQESSGDGDTAPGQLCRQTVAAIECARSAGCEQKQRGGNRDQHGQREQPSGDELPRRKAEEIKVQRLR